MCFGGRLRAGAGGELNRGFDFLGYMPWSWQHQAFAQRRRR